MRRIKTRHTSCAHHGENQGHNTADCIVVCREFDRYYDLFHEYLLTRGLGPYATGPERRGHKSSRHHPSVGRGRGQGGGFGQLPPPDLPPDLPRGQFANGPRHDFPRTIPTAPETWDTRGGGQQRGTGQPDRRTRTDMGSRVTKGALARALTARLEAGCLLYTSPSPRDKRQSRMPSSA